MSRVNDGGPAFPVPGLYSRRDGKMQQVRGMSLRDWFAGMAMQTIVDGMMETAIKRGESVSGGMRFVSSTAYEIADAMLAERERGGDA